MRNKFGIGKIFFYSLLHKGVKLIAVYYHKRIGASLRVLTDYTVNIKLNFRIFVNMLLKIRFAYLHGAITQRCPQNKKQRYQTQHRQHGVYYTFAFLTVQIYSPLLNKPLRSLMLYQFITVFLFAL